MALKINWRGLLHTREIIIWCLPSHLITRETSNVIVYINGFQNSDFLCLRKVDSPMTATPDALELSTFTQTHFSLFPTRIKKHVRILAWKLLKILNNNNHNKSRVLLITKKYEISPWKSYFTLPQ